METLLIDNYDSFSYNLYQYVGEIDPDVEVIRNDAMTVDEVASLKPKHIILSPGPGRPENAGIIIDVVKRLGETTPILGVCLGHQAICMAYGGEVGYAKQMMHGKQSKVQFFKACPIFADCPDEAEVARYHSLAAKQESLPDELMVVAGTEDGEVMAVAHKEYPVYGVQFHPESIMTPDGMKILRSFLKL